HHDGGAVLIIVKDRNPEIEQPCFDVETAWRGDVLQVDAAEDRRDQANGANDVFDVLTGQADGEGVHAGELLEQNGLPFHDRNRGRGAEIADPEDGRAVGNDGNGVVLEREVEDSLRIAMDLVTNGRDAGCVGETQIPSTLQLHLTADGQFPVQRVMQID